MPSQDLIARLEALERFADPAPNVEIVIYRPGAPDPLGDGPPRMIRFAIPDNQRDSPHVLRLRGRTVTVRRSYGQDGRPTSPRVPPLEHDAMPLPEAAPVSDADAIDAALELEAAAAPELPQEPETPAPAVDELYVASEQAVAHGRPPRTVAEAFYARTMQMDDELRRRGM